MSYDDLITKLQEKLNIPVSYYKFDEPTAPPFAVVFQYDSDNKMADGKVYKKIDVAVIEFYSDEHDETREEQIEDLLEELELPWSKTGTYIPEEHMFETRYEFEIMKG